MADQLRPLLDKGAEITTEFFDFDLSSFHSYEIARRDFCFLNKPIQGFTDFQLAFYEKLFNRKMNNLKTIYKRIYKMVDEYPYHYFLTLTFCDDYLSRTTSKYRRIYVQRFLKSRFESFVANVDYGDLHDREHYHAIVSTSTPLGGKTVKHVEYLPDRDKPVIFYWLDTHDISFDGGFFNVQLIRNLDHDDDRKRLGKYINKLKFHSSKDSTKFSKPIYSRRKKNAY